MVIGLALTVIGTLRFELSGLREFVSCHLGDAVIFIMSP